jgi:type II restriction enzyme
MDNQSSLVRSLIARWREDAHSTYNTWFLWEERLKNFRTIRRGLSAVIADIESGTFGNLYKGSSLEIVVGAIAEQRQVFKGSDHAFLWKPKLRIPDIYENRENQVAFGRFLNACNCCSSENDLVENIHQLNQRQIKGLGPAVANLLYFIHPTLMPPFNTAIVNGYNKLAGAKVKLGKWQEYLAMRSGILRMNAEHRDLLSNDLGAMAGLLFDLGAGRYTAPPAEDNQENIHQWEEELARVREESKAMQKAAHTAEQADRTHTEIQSWLRDLGHALGFDVWIASNDRNRACGPGRLGDGCLDTLPGSVALETFETVRLIDVLWFNKSSQQLAAGFEVEHTTSIYSGIVRLLDLALSSAGSDFKGLFLVAPDDREQEVRTQLTRPVFRRVSDLEVRFLPYGELQRNREAIARFGEGLKAIHAIARTMT